MNEVKLHETLKKKVPGHYTRIENCAGSGVPDCFACIKGKDFWIEHKILYSKSRYIYVRPAQINWMRHRFEQKGLTYILAADDDKVRLLTNVGLFKQATRENLLTSGKYKIDVSLICGLHGWKEITHFLLNYN